MLDRRQFLVRTGLTVAAGALAAAAAHGPRPIAARQELPSGDDWDGVRRLFDLDWSYLHFGGLLLASHPRPVREAIERHRRGLDDNPVHYLHQQEPALEADVLRAAAAYLGANPADIALTDSTTMGLGLLYNGLVLRPGQEILTTTHDFYATREALRFKAERSGATVHQVALYDQPAAASEAEIVDRLARAVTPRTRVVAVTWVHSSTGVKLPIRPLADALARLNAGRAAADRALLCVDGVHGLGAEDATVQALGCDFLVAGTHKWLFGPRGTGFVWGRPSVWAAATPTIPTFSGDDTPGQRMTPGGFHSFEHRWALAAAFDLHLAIGKANIEARIHALNRQLKEGLAAMPHVRLHTPLDERLSAGLVCFEVAGLTPETVVERLAERRIIATVTPYTTRYARLAAGLLNTPDEVETVLREVRALA